MPPDTVRSRPGMLDLWRIWLPAHRGLLPDLLAMLDAVEQRQYAAFQFNHLRERYAIRHGLMRVILSHYLAMPSPRQLELTTGLNGKPRLLNAPNPLSFNLTDSGDLAVLAVSAAGEVGVDVEQEQLDRPPLEILSQLAPVERDTIAALPPHERPSALYRVWVRKEAYLKARGDGLSVDLRGFCVPVLRRAAPDWPMQAVCSSDERHQWRGLDFVPEPGWVGCVVTPGGLDRLCRWDLTEGWVRQQMQVKAAEFA